MDFVGPLGRPTAIKYYGTVVAIAGGVLVAGLVPVIKKLRQAENKIITIVGAKCKDLLILENELKQESANLFFSTNDGSYGIKGFVTDILKKIINTEQINMVYAIGHVQMMQAVSKLTKEKRIQTIVSLNPIMLDGTGVCGACRVTVDKKTKFACIDGPEFDANSINWDELFSRLNSFKDLEKISLYNFTNSRECKCLKK
jgi:ferredoxin--NADP+ reductase